MPWSGKPGATALLPRNPLLYSQSELWWGSCCARHGLVASWCSRTCTWPGAAGHGALPWGGEGMASPGPSPESWGLVQVLAEPHSCEGVQRSPQKLSSVLGAEVSASRAVPRAVGCFLRAWWRAEVGGRGKTTSHYTLCGAACGGP